MKKTIFAVALTAALGLSAAQAETVLYGSLRFGMNYAKNHNNYEIVGNQWVQGEEKKGADLVDTGSRIGIKGGEDLGNGFKAIFLAEFAFDGMEGHLGNNGGGFSNRLAYIGLQSDTVGTFAVGRQDNPFHSTVVFATADTFNEVSVFAGALATSFVLTGGIIDTNGNGDTDARGLASRVGNAVAYVSPTWSGFSFNTALIIDAPNGEPANLGDANTSVDAFTVNAQYKSDFGLTAAIGYLDAQRVGDRTAGPMSTDAKVYSANVGFENDMFSAGVGYTDGKSTSDMMGLDFPLDVKANGWDIGGQFKFNQEMTSVRALVGKAKGKFATNVAGFTNETNITNWAIGLEHKLSQRTRVWAEYENQKTTYTLRVNGGINQRPESDKTNRFNMGVRHDF
ncbi:porin [Gammaproteobacteria bacterium]|nr:porin [Gammaproteobacteria bacterium]